MSEAERLYAESQVMEDAANRLRTEMQRSVVANGEAVAAINAIRELKDGKESEILVQLGMGAMLRASLTSVESIPVSVGAGVVIEKSPNDAINYLESRIKELDVAIKNIQTNLDKIHTRLKSNRMELDNMAKAQSSAGI